jgi:hypothetical protein
MIADKGASQNHPNQPRRARQSGHNAAIRRLRVRRLWCRHCRRRRAAHPIPAISAKTPNAATMLPSVSQSISKNPAAAAIATYLFSIGNCVSSRRSNPRRLRSPHARAPTSRPRLRGWTHRTKWTSCSACASARQSRLPSWSHLCWCQPHGPSVGQ